VHACRKSNTAVRRSLHAFDLINKGCAVRVCRVSTVTSISSEEMTEWTLAGSSGFDSCGGLGMPVVDGFFTAFACAPFRFRFAILSNVERLSSRMVYSIRMPCALFIALVLRFLSQWWLSTIDAAVPTRTSNSRWRMRNFSRLSAFGTVAWGLHCGVRLARGFLDPNMRDVSTLRPWMHFVETR
jgi:hypothetical protein